MWCRSCQNSSGFITEQEKDRGRCRTGLLSHKKAKLGLAEKNVARGLVPVCLVIMKIDPGRLARFTHHTHDGDYNPG